MSAYFTYLCIVAVAVSFKLPDVVLLHPPPGVLRVPVWGSFHLLAHILCRSPQNERLSARMHPQESCHVVNPGPQQDPAGVLGAVTGHLPLREEPRGRGRRHPDSEGAQSVRLKRKQNTEEHTDTSPKNQRPNYCTESSS